MKIVFFGTSNVALPVLETLRQNHEVVGVVTQPDALSGRKQELAESPVSVLSKEIGLKLLKPVTVKNNALLRMELQDLGADIFVVVSYGKILPADIISLPEAKTLNVHFSLLPRYRGASPIQSALLHGDSETGTTIMVMDEELDHGPVVTAEKYPIERDDNYITLSDRLAHASANLLRIALPDYVAGRLKPTEQNHGMATYTKIITKQDGKIDWSKTAQQIYNQFRAFYPWPGVWTTWNGKILKITDCLATLELGQNPAEGAAPGTVAEDGVVVCGNATLLKTNHLQLEGKNETDIQSFLNGYQNIVGSKLG